MLAGLLGALLSITVLWLAMAAWQSARVEHSAKDRAQERRAEGHRRALAALYHQLLAARTSPSFELRSVVTRTSRLAAALHASSSNGAEEIEDEFEDEGAVSLLTLVSVALVEQAPRGGLRLVCEAPATVHQPLYAQRIVTEIVGIACAYVGPSGRSDAELRIDGEHLAVHVGVALAPPESLVEQARALGWELASTDRGLALHLPPQSSGVRARAITSSSSMRSAEVSQAQLRAPMRRSGMGG